MAIDPLDENYFISAGPAGDPTVSVWDKRFASRSNPGTPSSDSPAGAVIEYRPAVNNDQGSSTIWSLRFSGMKRGSFGVLSNTGEVRIVELAQHSGKNSLHMSPVNHLGGVAWNSSHYTRVAHNLQYPWYDRTHDKGEEDRVIAYDFMPTGSPLEGQWAVSMRLNRQVEVMRIPERPAPLNFTALDELYSGVQAKLKPRPKHSKVADELIALRKKASQMQAETDGHTDPTLSIYSDSRATNDDGSIISRIESKSSRKMHAEHLKIQFPEVKLDVEDILNMLQVQKRRCQEGYLLDCRRNRSVVADDPWLVELWDLIERLDMLREDDGMVAQNVDLSYLGVWSIWSNRLMRHPNDRRMLSPDSVSDATFFNAVNDILRAHDYTSFSGVKTRYPGHRQLCLAICGWDSSIEQLRERSMALIRQGQYYKAIVLATLKGHKDLSLELLKYAVKQKLVQNIGLAAIIAGSTVNEEQREMCTWMADETDDPYLKALLAHFLTNDWSAVTDMNQLALVDRIGVALQYLDDSKLTAFLRDSLARAIDDGDIEGIVLTGLDEQAIDLLETYIRRFGDIQTAVLTLARVHPLYIVDERWQLWHEAYLFQMQTWRAFHERARFISQHNARSVNRQHQCVNRPPPQQLTIRCNNCQLSLARRPNAGYVPGYSEANAATSDAVNNSSTATAKALKRGANGGGASTPKIANGQACPQCGAPMPRCGICMMWLGSPDPAKPGGAAAIKEEDPSARQMVLCLACGHGFHGHHARDWFSRHQMCPVPDCQCMCALLR